MRPTTTPRSYHTESACIFYFSQPRNTETNYTNRMWQDERVRSEGLCGPEYRFILVYSTKAISDQKERGEKTMRVRVDRRAKERERMRRIWREGSAA